MKKVLSIIGARPQFIKHAPMQVQLQQYFDALTVHTGQHFDPNMSDIFFSDLNIPQPDFVLDIGGSKHHGEQTAVMLIKIEQICQSIHPDALLVYGDTNSTLAGTLVAAKMQIPIIHIEAGLRSYNRAMPEEINRIVADEFSYLLFCPTKEAVENLRKEGICHERVFLCGDVMCDLIRMVSPKITPKVDHPYYFATLHRPYNVDCAERLEKIINALNSLDKPVVFSVHPRTIARLKAFNIVLESFGNIRFIEPVGYLDSIAYQSYADVIITDSGGMQKEAYMLKKKCITVRSETEWKETLEHGWNTLVFDNLEDLPQIIQEPCGPYFESLYGNGHAAGEITSIIHQYL